MVKQILQDRYGVGIDVFDPIAIGWSAEVALQKHPVDRVRLELAGINARRRLWALPPVVFPYGHELF